MAVSEGRDERTKRLGLGDKRTEDGRISLTEEGLTGTPRLRNPPPLMTHGETSKVDTLLHRSKSPGLPALEAAKSALKYLTSSLLTFSPFMRAQKCVQMYLVSGGIASTPSESHGRVRSWLPEAPSMFFLRSSRLLE